MVVIAAMTLVTYLCRASGVVLMSRVTITPRLERALRAIPGSIVVATILPLGLEGGWSAVLCLVATILAMRLTRLELAALATGLATATTLRAIGL
jgi:uncharacterized membrane protein